ncbi:GNAT family N-acetyltransferase [Kitasatospora sp. NBC_00240]|uniref:GNAT family N-acetyltransferase n=1 Tax=Kitasatospora sp. NBC_00240 TaxID=2903567 RepID=UPI00224D5D63|nr:GNAT family N-acetyltransferase [Kitasatospora sp. NBC_00240]MCX5210353.1 GNAT family N-acetyltransferase [Kitasatospora sp. NBC_00240]
MTLMIRDFSPADAEAAAASHCAGRPHLVLTAEVFAWLPGHLPAEQHYRTFVAEIDGRVVGSVRCGRVVDTSAEGIGYANGSVLPEFRRRGAFTALLATAERHLAEHGATEVHSWVDDEPQARAFAAGRGYREGRIAHFARRDLTAPLPPVPALPAGVELRTAADYRDDPYPLFVVEADAARDEPGEVDIDRADYQDWLDAVWSRPDLDRELTVVAVVDGAPVAFSAAQTDGGSRYWSAFTACRREFRGRGLAGLAKIHSLHLARAAGLTEAFTSNDATNAPMLAINERLGYQRCASERKFVKQLTV